MQCFYIAIITILLTEHHILNKPKINSSDNS